MFRYFFCFNLYLQGCLALVFSTIFPLLLSSIVESDKMCLLEHVSLILNVTGTAAIPLSVKSLLL